ncbi:UNVERIFIED_CONTAM: hypothetical protein K2H54_039441 [Gekko kuhli]
MILLCLHWCKSGVVPLVLIGVGEAEWLQSCCPGKGLPPPHTSRVPHCFAILLVVIVRGCTGTLRFWCCTKTKPQRKKKTENVKRRLIVKEIFLVTTSTVYVK